MKERPILFSAPMVRAILAGKKTQTRRLVKYHDGGLAYPREDCHWRVASDGLWHPCVDFLGRGISDPIGEGIACKFGAPGDRLWVRETWAPVDFLDRGHELHDPIAIGYRADHAAISHEFGNVHSLDVTNWGWDKVNWRPSIHMPRWASRITLEVTDVRVDRLNDISEEDARAEGVSPRDAAIVFGAGKIQPQLNSTHRGAFAVLWDSINADRAPWDSNPWVWVVAFKRVQP